MNTSIMNHRPQILVTNWFYSSISFPPLQLSPAHHPLLLQFSAVVSSTVCILCGEGEEAGEESAEGLVFSPLIKCTGFAVIVRDGHVGGRYALPSFSRFFLFFGFVSATLHVHQLSIFMSFWLRAISVAIYTKTYNIAVSQQWFLYINAAKDLPSESVTEDENTGSRNRWIQRSVM